MNNTTESTYSLYNAHWPIGQKYTRCAFIYPSSDSLHHRNQTDDLHDVQVSHFPKFNHCKWGLEGAEAIWRSLKRRFSQWKITKPACVLYLSFCLMLSLDFHRPRNKSGEACVTAHTPCSTRQPSTPISSGIELLMTGHGNGSFSTHDYHVMSARREINMSISVLVQKKKKIFYLVVKWQRQKRPLHGSSIESSTRGRRIYNIFLWKIVDHCHLINKEKLEGEKV